MQLLQKEQQRKTRDSFFVLKESAHTSKCRRRKVHHRRIRFFFVNRRKSTIPLARQREKTMNKGYYNLMYTILVPFSIYDGH